MKPRLLAIVELGGYPNLIPLYQRLGFDCEVVNSQRRALKYLKSQMPEVIVCEYNFQSDFRDRTSNLETLMAKIQRHPEVRLVVFYQDEFAVKFQSLRERFPVAEALRFPVTEADMETALTRIKSAL